MTASARYVDGDGTHRNSSCGGSRRGVRPRGPVGCGKGGGQCRKTRGGQVKGVSGMRVSLKGRNRPQEGATYSATSRSPLDGWELCDTGEPRDQPARPNAHKQARTYQRRRIAAISWEPKGQNLHDAADSEWCLPVSERVHGVSAQPKGQNLHDATNSEWCLPVSVRVHDVSAEPLTRTARAGQVILRTCQASVPYVPRRRKATKIA